MPEAPRCHLVAILACSNSAKFRLVVPGQGELLVCARHLGDTIDESDPHRRGLVVTKLAKRPARR